MKEIFNDTKYEDESIVRNKSTRNLKLENLAANIISYKAILAKKNILHCSL